ncbi:MAG: metallophosphoesterase [Thermodesulfobacteriota bacterium]|nr:metallophosphoesterase [Thermodesulfobacteriota bacterium]
MNRWLSFLIFFSVFSLSYGGVHFYLYRRIRSHTNFPHAFYKVLAVFFGIMVISPVVCRMFAWKRFFVFGYVLTHISSLWIGFIFYFFLVSLIFDFGGLAYGLLTRGLSRQRQDPLPRNCGLFIMTIIIPLAICTYAYYEALNIRVTNVSIPTPKLPEGIKELVIAQISDAHLGVIIGEVRLKKITGLLRKINPDMIVSTGDLVDQEVDNIDHLAGELRSLTPPLGKYAVMGNHEFYAGVEKSSEFIKKAGFRLLRGERINVRGIINIVGIDDPAGRPFGGKGETGAVSLVARCDPGLFTLFLFHRPPNSEDYVTNLPIDLQLSGHTHGGQLYPFGFVTRIFFPLKTGLYVLNGRRLYVSRGVGTWGPPLRFLTPPEIVVVRLTRGPFHQRSGQ